MVAIIEEGVPMKVHRSACLAVAALAMAAPIAGASPIVDHGSDPSTPPRTQVVVRSVHDGFDWGSAGVGAAAGLIVVGAGAFGASHRSRIRVAR